MEKSPSIGNIAKALGQFHSIMGKIPKDATNPFFNSRYCTLSTILEFIKEPLQESGLSFTQFPCGVNSLVTVLMHESGEYMQSEFTIQPIKNDPQAQGSVISYMRRYGLAAILGLNLEDDDKSPTYKSGATSTKQQPTKEDGKPNWLNENTKEYNDVVEALTTGKMDMQAVKETWALNKNVRAALQDIVNGLNTPPQTSSGIDKPWLDKDSKKWDLVVSWLKNKTTTLAQVAQFFKLNREVRAELQSIINEAGTGTAMDNEQ